MNTPGNKAAKQAARDALATTPAIRKPIALILGGADNLEEDRLAALKLFAPDLIVATNNAGRDYPGHVDHWVTMHPSRTPATPGMEGWVAERRKAGRPDAGQLWIPHHRNPPKGLEPLVRRAPSAGGSSGLFACFVVVKMLCCRGVLVGVPMMAERRHYDDKRIWAEAPRYWGNWLTAARKESVLRRDIRSMSGKTRELFGAPTEEWLRGGEQRAA